MNGFGFFRIPKLSVLSGEQFSVGDLLGSGQEMDKTVQPKAKADHTSVCGVPGRYRMVSEQYTSRKWMDYLPFGGNPQGEA